MLYIVGVGPGDRELITVKAARCLRAADRVVAVDSGRESAVLPIVRELVEGKPVIRLRIPMHGERKAWEEAHRAAARTLLEYLDETLVWPMLGDPSLYASSGYVLPYLPGDRVCVVPGVTSFCAAAAALQIPLAQGRETLTVLPKFEQGDSLPPGNLAVLKSGSGFSALQAAARGRAAFAASHVGTAAQTLAPLQDAPQDAPYLTTVLVKP